MWFLISILFLNPKATQCTTGKRHNFKTFPFQILSSPNSLFRDQLSLRSTQAQIKHYSYSWERKEANSSAIIISFKKMKQYNSTLPGHYIIREPVFFTASLLHQVAINSPVILATFLQRISFHNPIKSHNLD